MDAQAKYYQLVETKIQQGMSRAEAARSVARNCPTLRAMAIAQANSQPSAKRIGTMVQAKATAKPMAMASMTADQFRAAVEQLMRDEGLSRQEAASRLSKSMRLSETKPSGNFFQQFKKSYRN